MNIFFLVLAIIMTVLTFFLTLNQMTLYVRGWRGDGNPGLIGVLIDGLVVSVGAVGSVLFYLAAFGVL